MLRRFPIFCLGCLILWGATPSLAPCFAQTPEGQPIRVLANTHAVSFGQQIGFHLEAISETPFTSIVLAYRTSDTQGTTVETISIRPSTSVSVDHVHEIARRYVRPFVLVSYWWTLADASPARLVTEPQHFVYADNRFDWQTLSADALNVHWYRGDLKVAQQALDVAIAGLSRAQQDIGQSAVRPIEVYFYANADDMRAALPPGSAQDAEALTLYETNVILISFGPEAVYIPELRRVLPHEVTHALLHEAMSNDHDRVPLWLSEGLATSVQYSFAPDPEAQSLLLETARQGTWLPLQDLCAMFPHDAAGSRLAYAESASAIGYIRDRYGRQGLRDLVAAYGDGSTCEGGVYRALGITLDSLETQWRASLAPQSAWVRFWQINGSWVILSILITAFPLAFLLPVRARTMSARH